MKNISIILLLFIILTVISGCKSGGTYRVTLDPSIDDIYLQNAWISYTAPIRTDMYQFNRRNSANDYYVPFHVELNARYNLMNFYLFAKNEHQLYDTYIEELIIIQAFGKLNEYVFFSFNPGNWINDKNFEKNSYLEWMNNNLPEHIPQTLATVNKIN